MVLLLVAVATAGAGGALVLTGPERPVWLRIVGWVGSVVLAGAWVAAFEWGTGMHCLGDDGVIDSQVTGSAEYRFCDVLDEPYGQGGARLVVDLWIWAPMVLVAAAVVLLLAAAVARRTAIARAALASAGLAAVIVALPATLAYLS
jgi:hypothetical protein